MLDNNLNKNMQNKINQKTCGHQLTRLCPHAPTALLLNSLISTSRYFLPPPLSSAGDDDDDDDRRNHPVSIHQEVTTPSLAMTIVIADVKKRQLRGNYIYI